MENMGSDSLVQPYAAQPDDQLETSVSRLQKGDLGGLEALYTSLRKPVFLLSYAILENYALAEDAAQETFLRVHDKASTYRPGSNPKAWVMSVARSVALNLRRKGKIEEPSEYPETNPSALPRSMEETAVLNADFTRALQCLEEPEKIVVILRIGCGLRHSESARVLGIKQGDARMRYSRALKKLKAYYRETD